MPSLETKSREQRAAESEVDGFRQDLGPFVVAAEATRMAIVFTDAREPGSRIIFANDSFLSLTGYGRDEVLGQRFEFLVAPSENPSALAPIKAAFVGESECVLDGRYQRRDGGIFWAATVVDPVRDKAGAVVQHFASFMDLSRHNREEERLRFLLDELNHRTQNTLATVQSIAVQTLRGVADHAVVERFEDRILALSKAHGLLGLENWDSVGLHDILSQMLRPFGFNDRRAGRFSVVGDVVRLQPKAALTLAMVFHELATNAAKHGALSNAATGMIDIAWRIEPHPWGDRMRLQWRERGGPPVTHPSHKGFGSRLIENGLAQDLGGEVLLNYEPGGVVCQIVMPIEPEARNDRE
jgi:PAS domain S-box-containing protein